MSFTDDVFVWALRVVFLLAVVWVVARWPKAAGPGVLSVLRRLVSIVVLVVLGVLNVAAPINAQYGWYSDWNDLLSDAGPSAVVPPQAARGDAAATAVNADVGPSPLTGRPTSERAKTTLSLTPTTSGGYQEFTVRGPVSGHTGTVLVWFPPSYTRPENARREYPVIETFHGFHPAPMAYFSVFAMDQAMSTEVAAGRVRDSLIVIPYWGAHGVDTECVNGSAGRLEDWVTQDVPAWIHANFRAASGRDSWATLGTSAGGYCALMSAMLRPQTFGSAISMGGYARPDFSTPYVPFTADSAQGKRYDMIHLAGTEPPPVALWVLASLPDSALAAPHLRELVKVARAPLSVTPTVLPTGGHRSEVWTPYFPGALAWLGSTSPGFAQEPATGGRDTPSAAPAVAALSARFGVGSAPVAR